jgi:hypothetical protein
LVVVVACMVQACAVVQLSTMLKSSYMRVPENNWCRWNSSLEAVSSLLRVWCIPWRSRAKMDRRRNLLEASVLMWCFICRDIGTTCCSWHLRKKATELRSLAFVFRSFSIRRMFWCVAFP